jgi:hypothetical protein
MRTSESVDKIAAALLAFQKEVTPPPKEQTNPFFKSKYCDLPTLLAHCKEGLIKNGLVFTSVGLTSRIMHTSGQWIEGDFACKTDQMSAQQVGAAESYGRRYGFQGLLGICAEDDDDGNAASGQTPPKQVTLKNIPTPPPKAAPPKPTPAAPTGAQIDPDATMIQATVLATSKARGEHGSYGILINADGHQDNCQKDDAKRIKCDCGGDYWVNTFHDTPWNTAKALKGKLGIFTMSPPNEKGYSNVEDLVGVS